MPTQTKQLQPPTGLSRALMRAPILFYKLGLGGLLGKRFLLLQHTGRKSGLPRQVLLEVVHHDEASGAYYIAAGFGASSDWFLNLQTTPQAEIQVGRRSLPVHAQVCDVAEATQTLRTYAQRHPRAAKTLAAFMGYTTDGSVEDFASLGATIKLVRLAPN